MKQSLFALLVLAFVLASAQAQAVDINESACVPIKNSDPLLQPGTVMLLGEMHGTNESPRFLHQVVCLALEQGHAVTVGLEIPFSETPRIQAYLDSTGDSAAVAHVLAGDFWHRPFQDGRSSLAMLNLIEALRAFRADGSPVSVLLVDDPSATNRDSVMTEHLSTAIQASPTDVFVVLTGNIHNRLSIGTSWDAAYEPMGYLLARAFPKHPLYALNVAYTGGEAWVCFGSQVSDCGVQKLKGNAEQGDGVELAPENTAYSGRYYVNTLTASRPVIEPGGHH